MNRKAKVGMVGILLLATIVLVAIGAADQGAEDQNAVPAAPQTNREGIPGLVCFRYNTFSDTWILAFEQTGPKEFIVSGYDPIYPAAMSGGGAIVSGKLLLTLDERAYSTFGTGGYAEHNIVINMAASPYTGLDRLVWFDINGDEQVNYPGGLSLTEIACPSGTQPAETGKRTADK